MPPRKGWKHAETCATCGKKTPATALRKLFAELRTVCKMLDPPAAAELDPKRYRLFQNAQARAWVETLLEDERDVCFGHEKPKPGRKPAGDDAPAPDPSDPRPPEERAPRKKRASALRVVSAEEAR